MMIQCPRCSTRWRVPNTSASENPFFKCGRCHNLFREFPGAPQPTTAEPRAAAQAARGPNTPRADNLEFIFPERPTGQAVADEAPEPTPVRVERPAATRAPMATTVVAPSVAAAPLAAPPPADTAVIVTIPSGAAPPDGDVDQSEASDDAPTIIIDTRPSAPEVFATDAAEDTDVDDDNDQRQDAETFDTDDEDGLEADEDDDAGGAFTLPPPGPALRVEERMHTSHAFGSIARGVLALVAVHAVLALLVRAAPERAVALLARVPIVGAGFARDPSLARQVQLRDLRGQYERLSSGRLAFVISGEAVNASDTTLERVRVEGIAYRATGDAERKTVSPGDRRTLGALPDAVIVFLQDFQADRTIAPGASAPFLIAFLEPPRDVRSFSGRVVTARATTRRGTTPTVDRRSRHPSVG